MGDFCPVARQLPEQPRTYRYLLPKLEQLTAQIEAASDQLPTASGHVRQNCVIRHHR